MSQGSQIHALHIDCSRMTTESVYHGDGGHGFWTRVHGRYVGLMRTDKMGINLRTYRGMAVE